VVDGVQSQPSRARSGTDDLTFVMAVPRPGPPPALLVALQRTASPHRPCGAAEATQPPTVMAASIARLYPARKRAR
jgi:hypothetical protein